MKNQINNKTLEIYLGPDVQIIDIMAEDIMCVSMNDSRIDDAYIEDWNTL